MGRGGEGRGGGVKGRGGVGRWSGGEQLAPIASNDYVRNCSL